MFDAWSKRLHVGLCLLVILAWGVVAGDRSLQAELLQFGGPPPAESPRKEADSADGEQTPGPPKLPQSVKKLLAEATPLNPEESLWLDRKNKAVYVQSYVVLKAGMLEMLCCPAQTKEHESILATPCPPQLVHAALLALGAESGKPAEFDDPPRPPQGEKLSIQLFWEQAEGKRKQQDAREWIRTATRRYFIVPLAQLPLDAKLDEDQELKYDPRRGELLHFGVITPELRDEYLKLSQDAKFQEAIQALHKKSRSRPLQAEWVFVGSEFYVDPETGRQYYLADAGEFICVANFPSAMIDVAILSSASDDDRGFEANSDVVPELGTPVLIQIQRMRDVPADKRPQAEPGSKDGKPAPPGNK